MKRLMQSGMLVLVMLYSVQAQAVSVPGPLVGTAWLARYLDKLVILDVRKDTKSFTARPLLSRDKKSGELKIRKVGAHIPGAILVDYGKLRVKRESGGIEVDKIIPEKAAFEQYMQSLGVDADSVIVIVSKGLNNGDLTLATRLYWTLKYFGQDQMAILDGGMAQWLLETRPISVEPGQREQGNWVARTERKEMLAVTEDVKKGLETGMQMVDNRPLNQYMGVVTKSYVFDSGHIPGAKLYPTSLITNNKTPTKLLPVQELRELAKGMGIDPDAKTITYCNSGQLASGGWFVMHELMGNDKVRLYDGSMHEWTLNKGSTTRMKLE
ncbi:MAG: sulfurtransferase [Gammaproteobacteria bacterium]|nr:sulfurtransferase [Gammaproteobacteria bacterium]